MENTASDRMIEPAASEETAPVMVLPSADVRQFLLELIDQANYPGKMIEFVVSVRREVQSAKISAEG